MSQVLLEVYCRVYAVSYRTLRCKSRVSSCRTSQLESRLMYIFDVDGHHKRVLTSSEQSLYVNGVAASDRHTALALLAVAIRWAA